MSTASKIESMVDALASEISSHVKSHHFRTFCKSIAPSVDQFNAFACLGDETTLYKSHDAFVNFCAASIWWEIALQIKIAIMADGDVEKSELRLAYEILQPAADRIALVDDTWAQFSPLLETEIGDLLDFATSDGPRLIRKYVRPGGELSVFCSPVVPVLTTATLATRSLDIVLLFKKVFTLAFKMIIQADGVVGDDERESYETARKLADLREDHCKAALEHLLPAFDTSAQETKGSTGGLSGSGSKPRTDEKQADPGAVLLEAAKELGDLIGLKPVKQEIARLANYLKVEAKRKASGLSGGKQSLHFVFTGNPGTGKTTVGRIMSKLLYGHEVLQTANLIETDRASLVGGFVGQTAIKTKEVLESALDGVLFIDEAYTLAGKGEQDFGTEAIDTILKAMEDNRDKLVIIAAGYTKNMETFLESNPGLKSRFTRFIHFPDYTPKDLCKIFLLMASQNQYELSQDAVANLGILCHALYTSRDRNFGNGRVVRNIFEKTLGNHADRIVELDNLTWEVLTTITVDDLPYDMAGLRTKFDLSSERWLAKCESCGTVHNASLKLLAKSVKCKCGNGFRVPCWSVVADGKPFAKLITADEDDTDTSVWD